jgi:hypothetical protein
LVDPERYRLTVEARKEEVKRLAAEGKSEVKIAEDLGVDRGTVRRDLGKGCSKSNSKPVANPTGDGPKRDHEMAPNGTTEDGAHMYPHPTGSPANGKAQPDLIDDDMPTQEGAEEAFQRDVYDHACSAGGSHFRVISAEDASKNQVVTTPGGATTSVYGNVALTTVSPPTTSVIFKPGQDAYIRIVRLPAGQQAPADTFVEDDIIQYIGARVKRG